MKIAFLAVSRGKFCLAFLEEIHGQDDCLFVTILQMISCGTETGVSIEQLCSQFFADQRQPLDAYLSQIPPAQRAATLQALLDHTLQRYGEDLAKVLGYHLALHPDYAPFWAEPPIHWQQGIFYVNTKFLKTRVALSLIDHPQLERGSVDYEVKVLNADGQLIWTHAACIHRRQTHTYPLSDLLPADNFNAFGMCMIESAERDLFSLRAYASWYNKYGITTTHEKKALANTMPFTVVPTIVATPEIETFIAVSNLFSKPLGLRIRLQNSRGQVHETILNVKLGHSASSFMPLSSHFHDMIDFLGGKAGALYIQKETGDAMFYYFIHHKKHKLWQIQHL